MKICGQRNVKISVPLISIFGIVAVLGLSVYSVASVRAEDGVFLNDSTGFNNTNAVFSEAKELNVSSKPVMIVRFNKKKIYYRMPLKRVVSKVKKIKPDAKYELQSIVPSGNTPKRFIKGYAKNINNIINVFGRFGVSADRISVNTVKSDLVQSQEVRILVK